MHCSDFLSYPLTPQHQMIAIDAGIHQLVIACSNTCEFL